MGKVFWKGTGSSFLAGSFLNLLLIFVFSILQKLGIIKTDGSSSSLILGLYAVVLIIYLFAAAFYFRRQSSNDLKKLKSDV